MNIFRSSAFIGCLFVRMASSFKLGGGSLSSNQMKIRRGTRKTQLVTKGIQVSETPQSLIINPPTDFAKPAEKIKLTDRPAPNTSVYRLPSRYPKTIPHTKPNGKPLVKRKTML